MDCEKCEDLMLDELYGELDDVTSALVRRHVAGCSRCNAMLADLKGTRELVSSFPLVTAPSSLEERIFAAEKEARKVVPIRSRALSYVSIAGRWAMRPQTAMAALFLLMIGSTTFLLKGRNSAHSSAITVAQEGSPVAAAAPTSDNEALAPNAARGAHGPLEMQPVTTPPPAASMANVATADDGREDGDFAKVGKDKNAQRRDEPAKDLALAQAEEYGPSTNAAAPAGAPMPTTMARNAPPAPARVAAANDPYAGADSKSNGAGGGSSAGYGQIAAAGAAQKKEDGDDFSQGMTWYRSQQYPNATQSFDRAGSNGDLNGSLWAARSVRDGQGCATAIPRLDSVAARGGSSFVGAEATFDSAQCYAQVGATDTARAKYTQLLNVPTHAQRAQQALDALNQVAARAAKAPASKPKAAAPATPPPAQAAAAQQQQPTQPAPQATPQSPPTKASDRGL